MRRVLLDTHTWVWALFAPEKIPERAANEIATAAVASVCAISVYEIGQKVRRGIWPGMDKVRFEAIVTDTTFDIMPPTARTFQSASLMDWAHRDPFDRIIGAMAIEQDMALVSSDTAFDALDGVNRIWK